MKPKAISRALDRARRGRNADAQSFNQDAASSIELETLSEDFKLLRNLLLLILISSLVFFYQASLRLDSVSTVYDARVELAEFAVLGNHLPAEYSFSTDNADPLEVTLTLTNGAKQDDLTLVLPAVASAMASMKESGLQASAARLKVSVFYLDTPVNVRVSESGIVDELGGNVAESIEKKGLGFSTMGFSNEGTLVDKIELIKERCPQKWLPIKLVVKNSAGVVVLAADRIKMTPKMYSIAFGEILPGFHNVGFEYMHQLIYRQPSPSPGGLFCELEYLPAVATFDTAGEKPILTSSFDFVMPDSLSRIEVDQALNTLRGSLVNVGVGLDLKSDYLLVLIPLFQLLLSVSISITLRRMVMGGVPLVNVFFWTNSTGQDHVPKISFLDGPCQRLFELFFRNTALFLVLIMPSMTLLASSYLFLLPGLYQFGWIIDSKEVYILDLDFWREFWRELTLDSLIVVGVYFSAAIFLFYQMIHQVLILWRAGAISGRLNGLRRRIVI